MWYKTLILISAFLVDIFSAHCPVVEEMKGRGIIREAANHVLYAQPVAEPSAKDDEAKKSEKEDRDPSTERKNSNTKHKRTSPESIKKSGPLKDFVPSEKIEADQAVDFPADI